MLTCEDLQLSPHSVRMTIASGVLVRKMGRKENWEE